MIWQDVPVYDLTGCVHINKVDIMAVFYDLTGGFHKNKGDITAVFCNLTGHVHKNKGDIMATFYDLTGCVLKNKGDIMAVVCLWSNRMCPGLAFTNNSHSALWFSPQSALTSKDRVSSKHGLHTKVHDIKGLSLFKTRFAHKSTWY